MLNFFKKNIFNALFISVLLLFVFVPNTKAYLLRGLIQIGLFKPEISTLNPVKVNLSGIIFKNEQGKPINLGDLEGKVLFINFWATWCPPCRAEMPSINTLYQQFKDDKEVVFLFVDADADFEKSSQFLKNHQYDFPLYAMAANIPDQMFSGSLPTTLIFDKKGRLSFKHEGLANYADQKFVDFIGKLKQLNH